MFRVEVKHEEDQPLIKVEGQLSGAYAAHAQSRIPECELGTRFLVDVTDVTSVDQAGEKVLTFLGRFGGRFIADNSFAKNLCDRLNLPLASVSSSVPAKRNGKSRKGKP
jgi:hypothetical protein